MINILRNGLVIITLLFSLSASALTLQEAKGEGLVGEQPNGYLGIVGNATPEVRALVEDINSKRRNAYQNIANKNNTQLKDVEQLAGQKAIRKTASGNYVQQPSGGWQTVP